MRARQRVGAYALVLDDAGRVLLCRMSAKTRTPGRWTLPGGGLRHGESPDKAVLRELAEETGVQGQGPHLLGVHSNVYGGATDDAIHGVRLIYGVTPSGGAVRAEDDDTTDDARWFELDRWDALDVSDHARYGLLLLSQRRRVT